MAIVDSARECGVGKALLALLAAIVLSCALSVQTAFADDSYEMALVVIDCPQTLEVGDAFTVTQTLAKTGESSFPLYALSTTVAYDTAALELVSCEASDSYGDVYSRGGNIVYNAYSRSLSGITTESGSAFCTMTFKVLVRGKTNLSVKRVNMSNYTGKRSMPCTATGLSVAVGSQEAIASEASTEGSTAGNATEVDYAMGTTSAQVDLVKENPSAALEDGRLTASGYKSLAGAGMTDDDLQKLGFTKEELDRVKAGEAVEPAFAAALANDASVGKEAASDSGIPPALIAVGAIVLIAVAGTGIFLARRSSK